MISSAIDSALKYSDFTEIIIASNGETLRDDIPEKYLKNKKIKIVRSSKRLNMPDNWYFGFEHAHSKWVRFLADDDFMVINPTLLLEILNKSQCSGIKFDSKTFSWTEGAKALEYLSNSEVHTNQYEVTQVSIKTLKNKFWTYQRLSQIPGGAAGSIIRRDFLLELQDSKFLFSGIAPDWNTSAHYLHSEENFTKVNLVLDYLGVSKYSSVYMAQNLDSVLNPDPLMYSESKLHPRLKNFSSKCPMTWLSRIDSMLWARQRIGLNTGISDRALSVSAMSTTPSMVKKMYKYLIECIDQTFLLKATYRVMYALGIFRYIKFQLRIRVNSEITSIDYLRSNLNG